MSEIVTETDNAAELVTGLEYGEVLDWLENIFITQKGSLVDRDIVASQEQVAKLYQSPYEIVRKAIQQSTIKEDVAQESSRFVIDGIIDLNRALSFYDGQQASVINRDGEYETVDIKGVTCDALTEYYDDNNDANSEPTYPPIGPENYHKYTASIVGRDGRVHPYSNFRALLIPEEDQ